MDQDEPDPGEGGGGLRERTTSDLVVDLPVVPSGMLKSIPPHHAAPPEGNDRGVGSLSDSHPGLQHPVTPGRAPSVTPHP